MQLDQDWLHQQGADAMLLHFIDTCFVDKTPKRIGIAVSGGGDSVALLHLFWRWSVQTGGEIFAVTVDHGLRPESAAEADAVARLCQSLGIPHDTLRWHHNSAAGNLPAAAREGRYHLMAQWAASKGVGGIALGHTRDDGAENFLMRLGRAAGVDGLASMETRFDRRGVTWVRPLWQQSRADLRDYLRRHGLAWAEDPSNDDPRYTRTKARKALAALADLGIDANSIHQSAFALRMARSALEQYTFEAAQTHVSAKNGDLLIPLDTTPPLPVDISRRLMVAALQWVGSLPYPPRQIFAGVLEFELMTKPRHTVAGCLLMKRKTHIRITREHNAVRHLCAPTDAVWDSRWQLDGPHAPDLEIRALGETVSQLPDWRATGLPRASLMASPAIWRDGDLIAAPLAGYNPEWTARIVADFNTFLLSH